MKACVRMLPWLLAGAIALVLAGCGELPKEETAGTNPTMPGMQPGANAPANAPAAAPPADRTAKPGGNSAATPASGGTKKVTMETSMGTIKLELNADKAPITVKNFLEYVAKGHYAGTIFHRVIPGFMIQGGGFTKDLEEKPTGPGIENEGGNGLKNDRGTIAMARTSDPNSATAQFFISVADNAMLNRETSGDGAGYAVFGKVTAGMDVVDKIVAVRTTSKNGMDDVPVEPITIKSVKAE